MSDDPTIAPGDEAHPDAPAAAEVPGEHCGGKGTHDDGSTCPVCDGTGVTVDVVGGG